MLNPGELIVTELPHIVTTVLGSCISLTIFSSERQIGIMNHAILPAAPPNYPLSDLFRYVDTSFNYILNKIKSMKIPVDGLEIKLFGGANMMHEVSKYSIGVGDKNIEVVLSLIKKNGLFLKARDVGGRYGRRVIFNTTTGEVLVKKLK